MNLLSFLYCFSSLQIPPQVGFLPVSRSACLPSTTISKPWSWSDITLRFGDLTEVWVIAGQSRSLCRGLYFLLYACAIWELIEFYLSSVLLFSGLFRREKRGDRAAGGKFGSSERLLPINMQSVSLFCGCIHCLHNGEERVATRAHFFTLFFFFFWHLRKYTINSYSVLSGKHSTHKSVLWFIRTVVHDNLASQWNENIYYNLFYYYFLNTKYVRAFGAYRSLQNLCIICKQPEMLIFKLICSPLNPLWIYIINIIY